MKRIRIWLAELFGPASKFDVGDRVELLHGGQLMVVIEIVSEVGAENPRVLCQWTEAESNRTRREIFRENELRCIGTNSLEFK